MKRSVKELDMKRKVRVRKVEELATRLLPQLYKNRFQYGMGGSPLKDFVPMAVDSAKAIIRRAAQS